jgi:squalene cyclase
LNDDWAHPEALRAYLIAELLFSELGDTTSKEYQIVKSRINKYRYPEGGWGQIRDYKANIYETALTLYSKKKLSEDTALDQSALTKWQNRDGGWGFYQGELSNIICTALATAALARTDSSNRGAEWLLTHQKSDGSWGLTTETAQGTGQPNSIFIHSNTPWVILALTEEGMLEGEPIDRGVEALLRLQDPVGGWRVTSSFYWAENIRLSVWATGFAIFALGSMLEQVEALKLRRSA